MPVSRSPLSPAPVILALLLVLGVSTLPADLVAPVSSADDEAAGGGNAALAAEVSPVTVAAPSAVLGTVTCDGGFRPVRTAANASLEGVALTPEGAWSVGFSRLGYGARRPVVMRNTAGRWQALKVVSPGGEDGLVAVAARDEHHAWAVGFTTPGSVANPLAMRWDGRSWRIERPPARSDLPSLLTDVALGRDGRPWAVGYRMTGEGTPQPIVVRRFRREWRYGDLYVGPRESIALTGIADDGEGGFWAVGHGGRGSLVSPVVYRHDGRRWRRQKAPRVRDEGVLTDVVATGGAEAWAVGYQVRRGRSAALVLRWDGRVWERVAAPRFGSGHAVLTAVSEAPTGGIWAVGARWRDDLASHEAVAAWWDGKAWSEVTGMEGGSVLSDVAGAPDAEGWAVGRFGQESRAARVCGDAQVRILGGSEPGTETGPLETVTSHPLGSPLPAPSDDEDAPVDHEVGEAARPDAQAPEGGLDRHTRQRPEARLRSGRRRRAPPPLPTPSHHATIVGRNVAREVGLAESTATYGAVVADFDGDGQEDVFIGRHGRPARLALNREGSFVDHDTVVFPRVDRHGCSAADVDGSGLPDLYCTVGGSRGSGFKANELWIDPGSPAPTDRASAAGVMDATGRGRLSTFLRSRRGIDLVVTNAPVRVDGLPSPGRLFRSRGDGTFVARDPAGFAARLGALALQRGDYDADGRDDLLLVTGGAQAPLAEGTSLYRNSRQGLVDVTARLNIRSFGEVDATLVDLDRDGRLDLVRLSTTRLRVSLWRKGHFRPVYEAALTHGRALASGDVDGDRYPDLYIVRGNSRGNPADVMLLNRKRGWRYRSMVIPQVYGGDGEDAVAIDHDGNGLMDFLVLNGRSVRGPVALVAFYQRGAARGR